VQGILHLRVFSAWEHRFESRRVRVEEPESWDSQERTSTNERQKLVNTPASLFIMGTTMEHVSPVLPWWLQQNWAPEPSSDRNNSLNDATFCSFSLLRFTSVLPHCAFWDQLPDKLLLFKSLF
jgi:hypothetical protein